MRTIALNEASARLAELTNEAAGGEEVVITRDDGAKFKIVPIVVSVPAPKFGSAKGLIVIRDEFDHPVDEFQAYAP